MWDNITGQINVIEKLKSVYKSRRIAHSFLFYGIDGTGKDAAAIEFAKLLNCMNVQNGDEACDVCSNCKKTASLKSELLQIINALPAGKSEQSDSEPLEKLDTSDFDNYMEQLNTKAQNPYHRIVLPGANNIRINSIRKLVSKIYLSSSAGTRKVFLISEADKMKMEAANALLKVLEEPPKNSILILTTSKINSLPQTISGRCQRIYFEPLTNSQIKDKLTNSSGSFNTKGIEIASSLSGGSYTKAAELLEMGVEDIRNSAVAYLIALLKDDYAETVMISRDISAKNNRDKVRYFLFVLNMWFRDLLKIKFSVSIPAEISNYDLKERLINFNNNYPETDIYGIIVELEKAEEMVSQNVQLQLIILTLAFKLKNLLKK